MVGIWFSSFWKIIGGSRQGERRDDLPSNLANDNREGPLSARPAAEMREKRVGMCGMDDTPRRERTANRRGRGGGRDSGPSGGPLRGW